MRHADFTELVVRDLALLAITGGALGWVLFGSRHALSFSCGCLWAALNFGLLSWLIDAAVGEARRHSQLFIFLLACAKIPASYFVLYWLYSVDYLEPVGLSIGLAALPLALVFRALAMRAGGEEGRSKLAGSP